MKKTGLPLKDLRKPLGERALTILEREFGYIPEPLHVRLRGQASSFGTGDYGEFRWLWSLRGCGRSTAEEIATWAGIRIP